MTTYSAARNFGGTGGSGLGVLAGTYPVRISKIEFWGSRVVGGTTGTQIVYASVTHCAGASFSGGTSITPLPMRGGAPPSTATVKYGYSSVSGTKSFLTIISTGSPGPSGSPSTANYTFPFDYILAPGSAIDVNGGGTLDNTYNWAINIFYEELRLAWST